MAHVVILKKNEGIEQLKTKLQSVQKNTTGINAQEYSGIISLKEDPAKYQKRMRNEWN